MSSNDPDASLVLLLDRLREGDVAAAERIFLTYEPYLRLFVRRQLSAKLRVKFDSVDIVQSVWADLLLKLQSARWSFRDAGHLRAFLVKVTRHHLIDRVRRNAAAVQREQPLDATSKGELSARMHSTPSDQLQAKEVWQQLLELCPAQHKELLDLKSRGYSLDDIAARTGLHASSVRRILYDLARRFALRNAKPH